jgi:predicted porin
MNSKRLVAMAVAAAASAASAQSSVTIFGTLDVAATHGSASGANSASMNSLTTSSNTPSKLGFRGSEDLGGGMTASFWLEMQLAIDDGRAGRLATADNRTVAVAGNTGANFSRRSTVSLAGPFGEFRFGRDLSPTGATQVLYDPFGNIGVGSTVTIPAIANGLNAGTAFSLSPTGIGTSGPLTRVSNTLAYYAPANLGGFFGMASLWLGESPRNGGIGEKDGNGFGTRFGYRSGPVEVALAYNETRYRATPVAATPGAPSGDLRMYNIGGSWNLRFARLVGFYDIATRQSAVQAQARGWLVGGFIPVGPHEIKFAVSQSTIDGGPGADPRARSHVLGYVHNLSKRTALYTNVARVNNSNGARLALGGSSIGAGVGNAHSTGLDIGVRHNF